MQQAFNYYRTLPDDTLLPKSTSMSNDVPEQSSKIVIVIAAGSYSGIRKKAVRAYLSKERKCIMEGYAK